MVEINKLLAITSMKLLTALCTLMIFSSFNISKKQMNYIYIEDYQRVLEFTDSKSEFMEGKKKIVLKIERPELVHCQVFMDHSLIEQGNFVVTNDVFKQSIMVPIDGFDDALMDGTINYPIFKKSGNWIWPLNGTNHYYFEGIQLSKNQMLIHLENLQRDILLTEGKGETEFENGHYSFRSNEKYDTIQYWRIEGFNNFQTGYFFKTSGVKSKVEKATIVVNGYEIQTIDSLFTIPIYASK